MGVVFTVGAWPDFDDPYTPEGIHKVVMLDLVARHAILTRLRSFGLLSPDGCVVMSVLGSVVEFPSFLVGDVQGERTAASAAEAVKSRMRRCVVRLDDDDDEEEEERHRQKRERGHGSFLGG